MDSQPSGGLAAYFGALRRRRGLMAWIAGPIAIGALVVALALPDRYSSAGLISIEQQRLEGVRSSTRTASDEFVQEYVRSLSSTLLTEKGTRAGRERAAALSGSAVRSVGRSRPDGLGHTHRHGAQHHPQIP